ncbi:unnamed protein product [Effrenium voratum]|nr:unnamed protein product [Effrenium voratum]
MASPDLMWECLKNQSCFLRKSKNMPTMTAEPGNLCGINAFRFSGLCSKKVLGLDTKTQGKKESIVLTMRSQKFCKQFRPKAVLTSTGIKKGKKQGPEQLKKIVASAYNRPELLEMALKKYKKTRWGFLGVG